jgi:hypothetical protein
LISDDSDVQHVRVQERNREEQIATRVRPDVPSWLGYRSPDLSKAIQSNQSMIRSTLVASFSKDINQLLSMHVATCKCLMLRKMASKGVGA